MAASNFNQDYLSENEDSYFYDSENESEFDVEEWTEDKNSIKKSKFETNVLTKNKFENGTIKDGKKNEKKKKEFNFEKDYLNIATIFDEDSIDAFNLVKNKQIINFKLEIKRASNTKPSNFSQKLIDNEDFMEVLTKIYKNKTHQKIIKYVSNKYFKLYFNDKPLDDSEDILEFLDNKEFFEQNILNLDFKNANKNSIEWSYEVLGKPKDRKNFIIDTTNDFGEKINDLLKLIYKNKKTKTKLKETCDSLLNILKTIPNILKQEDFEKNLTDLVEKYSKSKNLKEARTIKKELLDYIFENRDLYAIKLQLLCDKYFRSDTEDKANAVKNELLKHINSFPNDSRQYVLRALYDSNLNNNSTMFIISFRQRSNFIQLVENRWKENKDNSNVTSNQISDLVYEHIIDMSIIDKKFSSLTRKNNDAGLFNYYYEPFKYDEINQALETCQIFTLKQINDKKYYDKIVEHCIISSVKYFYTEEEQKTDIFKNKMFLILKEINKNLYAPKKIFKNLSIILDETISLIEEDPKESARKFATVYKKGVAVVNKSVLDAKQNKITIGLIKNHCFPYIDLFNFKALVLDVIKARPDEDLDLSTIDRIEWEDKENGLMKRYRTSYYQKSCNTFDFIQKMLKLNFLTHLSAEEASKVVNLKCLAEAYKLNEDFNLRILESDLKRGIKILPSHKVSKDEGVREMIFKAVDSFAKNCKEKIDDKTKNKVKIELLNSIHEPKGFDDMADYIVHADCESTSLKTELIKGNKSIQKSLNIGYSIDYTIHTKSVLEKFITNPSSYNSSFLNIRNEWGLEKQFKILPTDTLIKNEWDYTLIRDNEEFIGYPTLNNHYFNISDSSCLERFLKHLWGLGDISEKVVVYFHNMKFDRSLFSKIKNLVVSDSCKKNGQLYSVAFKYKGKDIKFYDSYKMIPNPLKDFPKMFGLSLRKEYMPYKIFTPNIVDKEIISIQELKYVYGVNEDNSLIKKNGKTYVEFLKHIIENKIFNFKINGVKENILFDENMKPTKEIKKVRFINIKHYSIYYSTFDVKILFEGHLKFAQLWYEFKYTPKDVLNPKNSFSHVFKKYFKDEYTKEDRVYVEETLAEDVCNMLNLDMERGFNVFNFLTVSSLADNLFIYKNCYKGVYTSTGTVRDYIMKSSYGGQTMTSLNKTYKREYENQKTIEFKNQYKEEYENLLKFKNDEKYVQMEREFQLKYYKNYISDYDAVSCYPSAMLLMDGFIMGKPEIFNEVQLNNLKERNIDEIDYYVNSISNRKAHYFVSIKIKNSGCESLFPNFKVPINELIKDSKLKNSQWENQAPKGEMVVDKYMLRNIVETHNLSYEDFDILYGVYYPRGYNNTINSVMNELKEMRDKYKKENNPLQAIVKLIMNSCYGKNLLTASEERIRYYVGTEKDLIDNCVQNNSNFNMVVLSTNINIDNENLYEISSKISDYGHHNRAHIGASILGYSKIIMGKPKKIADSIYRFSKGLKAINENEEKIFKILKEHQIKYPNSTLEQLALLYTDTDSMMGSYEVIYLIMKIYKELYGTELDGNEFGQFHIDFKMSNPDLVNVFATKSIFINKKEYCLVLEGYNPKTNEFEFEEKMAYKGIKQSRIIETAMENFNTKFPIYDFFSSNKLYSIDVVGEDGFKVAYQNKGGYSESVESMLKKVNLKRYDKTYHRFAE